MASTAISEQDKKRLESTRGCMDVQALWNHPTEFQHNNNCKFTKDDIESHISVCLVSRPWRSNSSCWIRSLISFPSFSMPLYRERKSLCKVEEKMASILVTYISLYIFWIKALLWHDFCFCFLFFSVLFRKLAAKVCSVISFGNF